MAKNNSKPKTRKNSISARKKTYEYLKEKVLSGSFTPGERLTEEHLAEELGVSRTPIREALHKLELEGLVKPLETRGFCVSLDSVEEMEEIFEIRAILEGYALRSVCQDISAKEIERLNQFVDRAEEALKDQKREEVFRYNTDFHDMIHSLLSHKNRLVNLMVDMRKYVLRYRKNTLDYLDGAQRSIDGHKKLILALKLKDPVLCEQMMREHVSEAKEDAIQAILDSSQKEKS